MKSDRLYGLFKRYLEYAAANIQQDEIPSIAVQQTNWIGDGQFETNVGRKKDLARLLVVEHSFVDSDPAQDLLTYVKEEYDFELSDRYLQLVLVDVFGEEGEYFSDWEDRIEEAFEKFAEDIDEQRAKFRQRVFLNGLEIDVSELEIADDAVLRKPTSEDRSYTERLTSLSYFNPTEMAQCSAVLEFDIENKPEYEVYPPGQILQKMYLKTLRLYGRGTVPVIATTHDLRTYLGDPVNMSVPNSQRSPLPRSTVSEEDGSKILDLVDVLSSNYSEQDVGFPYPLSAAIDHYETSIEKRVYTRESITFAVIGLESLYTSGRGKVSSYCAFLLASASSYFDAETVQQTIEEAYDYRNSWAHGASRERESTDIQHMMWDYLRASIVTFGILNQENGLDKQSRNNTLDQINRAFIEENHREKLLADLDTIELENYLQLPKQEAS